MEWLIPYNVEEDGAAPPAERDLHEVAIPAELRKDAPLPRQAPEPRSQPVLLAPTGLFQQTG